MAELGALISALPGLIQLLQQFMSMINKMSGNDPAMFVQRVSAAMEAINNAETDEDRQKAANSLSDAIRGL